MYFMHLLKNYLFHNYEKQYVIFDCSLRFKGHTLNTFLWYFFFFVVISCSLTDITIIITVFRVLNFLFSKSHRIVISCFSNSSANVIKSSTARSAALEHCSMFSFNVCSGKSNRIGFLRLTGIRLYQNGFSSDPVQNCYEPTVSRWNTLIGSVEPVGLKTKIIQNSHDEHSQ